MITHRHRFKCIVTALALGVGISLPSYAQDGPNVTPTSERLDELYQNLLDADEANYLQIEQQIVAEWEKSGSPAMDLLLRRGHEALDANAPEVAVEHFTALLDHAPGFAEGYYGRATAYYLLGLVGPALADVGEALRLNPRHFEAMRGLAVVMQDLGRKEDALELYNMILEISPKSVETQEAVDFLTLELEGQSL